MASFASHSRASFQTTFSIRSLRRSFADARSVLAVALVSLLAATYPASAQTAHAGGTITTLGSGFSNPFGTAMDSSGNIFVVDYNLGQVKEILAAGGYSTVISLGSGLSHPTSIALDSSGNLFIGDTGNNAVKEILAAGGYTTINTLGSGFSSPFGVALDSSGNLFVTDSGHNAIKEITIASNYTTVNTLISSGLSYPYGIALDSNGDLFVADDGNNAVKEILATGGYTTVVTLGSGFSSPQGVAVDQYGNVFVGDTGHSAVKEILAAGGYTTVNALGSGFNAPEGVAVDRSGNVYVADSGNSTIKMIQAANINFGSASVATTSPVTLSMTFTFDTGGTILTPSVVTQGATGLDFTDAGTGTCAAGTYSTGNTCTVNVRFVPKAPGVRYGAATLKNSSGTVIATAYLQGTGVGPQATFSPAVQSTLGSGIAFPFGAAVDASGNVFVTDYTNNQVKEVIAAGGYTTTNVIGSGFSYPTGVAVDGSGNVFVADYLNSRIKEVLAAGGYTTVLTLASGFTFNQPVGVAVDGSGNVFVAGYLSNQINEILAAGGYTTVLTLGGGFAFNQPTGVAVDGAGNVFVAGYTSHQVNEILAAGGYTTVQTLGSGLSQPTSVAVDPNGNVFVVDRTQNVVKKILAAGGYTTVSTVATGLSSPFGLALGANGNLYVANNNSVKKLDFASPPTLAFASTAVGTTSSDSPKTVTLTNSGNATLTFPTPASGLNPSIATNFSLGNSSTCPQLSASSSPATLAAGVSCTNLISFSPTAPGSISGSLAITDDALNAPGPSYITQSLALSGTGTLATPAIAFTVPTHTYGDAPFTVTATSNSTGAFTYSLVSGPATISGVTVTLTGAGSVVLQASEAADSNYAATTSNATFTVSAATPTITFNVPSHTYGDAPFTVGATSNSTGAITYSVVSGPATVAGATVTLTGAGTVVLQASEASDSNYIAGSLSATFTVSAATPVIAFSVPSHTYGDAPFTVGATSNSTGAITYSVVSGPATVAAATVTLTGAGAVVLQASEASDGNYIASTGTATFTVAAAAPTLALSVSSHTYGDAPFTVGATSNSTGAFTYSVVSGPATVAGATVSVTGAGTVVLQVAQAASNNYLAGSTSATFTVATGTPTLTFAIPGHTYGDAAFSVGATSTSPGALTYTVVSGPATIAGTSVSLTGTGTVVVQATQAATANYGAGSASATFAVAAATPTLTFTIANHTFGDAPFVVAATSNSPAALTYTVVSGPATVSGATVTLTGAGTVVLQASQPASGNYLAASITASFAAISNSPTLVFAVPSHTFGDAPFAVTATSNSSGILTYSVVSGPATLNGVTVTLTGAGLVTVQVTQAATASYAAASSTASFAVAPGTPTLAFSVPNHIYGDAPFAVAATSNSTGGVTYAVVSGPATLTGATITMTGAGLVTVRASQAATANYVAASVATTFLVNASLALAPEVGPTSSTQTAPAGTSAAFKLTFTPGGGTYLNPVQLSVTGLPPGATATFFPSIIPAGTGSAAIVLIVQTAPLTAHMDRPYRTLAPLVLALLLMPFVGHKSMRRRLRNLPMLLALLVLSLATTLGLSGCGGVSNSNAGKSYPLTVTATDTVTGVHIATTVTLIVQ